MLLLGVAAVFVFVVLVVLAIAWPWLASTSDEPLERRSRPGCDDDEAA